MNSSNLDDGLRIDGWLARPGAQPDSRKRCFSIFIVVSPNENPSEQVAGTVVGSSVTVLRVFCAAWQLPAQQRLRFRTRSIERCTNARSSVPSCKHRSICPAMPDISLLLIEQVIADAEHVHAGPDRLQAGCPGAERFATSASACRRLEQRIGSRRRSWPSPAGDRVIG